MDNNGLTFYNGADEFAKKINGRGSYVLVMGNTDTALIPGITAAGACPELMCYTPPLDAELVHTGKTITIDELPFTPESIPTPGLITRAAITLSDFREFYVDAGLEHPPMVPHYRVGFSAGKDIRTGKAVSNVKEIIENAKKVGAEIASQSEYIVIGESIAAGTTTALGVLLAMGYSVDNYTSSSMNKNPQTLKTSVVLEGLRNAGIKEGCDPIKAIESVGDPMQAATIGLILGARNVPIILAGGTQMASVLVLFSKLFDISKFSIALSTTRWVAQDSSSNLFGILKNTGVNVPVIISNLSFARSKYEGLRSYEAGNVKEGVGAGGIAAAAIMKGVPVSKIEEKVDEIYSHIVG